MENYLLILNSETPDKVFTEKSIKTLPSTEEFFDSRHQMLVRREIEWLLKNRAEHQ